MVPERGDERLRELIVSKSYRLIYKLVADDELHVIALYTALVISTRFFGVRAVKDGRRDGARPAGGTPQRERGRGVEIRLPVT